MQADTLVAELVDALDLKSSNPKRLYGFNSRLGYYALNTISLKSA
jgi:hypothetical protein